MKYLVGPMAFVLFLLMLDRLRQIRFPVAWIRRRLGQSVEPSRRGDAKPLYILMYLLKMGYAFGVFGVAVFTDETWWRLALAGVGVAGILCWAINTRRQWADGPPPQVLSGTMPLDPPISREWPTED